jgi:hypothetical protein
MVAMAKTTHPTILSQNLNELVFIGPNERLFKKSNFCIAKLLIITRKYNNICPIKQTILGNNLLRRAKHPTFGLNSNIVSANT